MKAYMLFLVLPVAGLITYFSIILPQPLQQIFVLGIFATCALSVLLKPVVTAIGYICSYKATVAQSYPKPKPRKPRPRIARTKIHQQTSGRRRVA